MEVMAKFVLNLLCIAFLLFSCRHKEKIKAEEKGISFPITFDSQADYPDKRINIEEIADISYIVLQTTDTFLGKFDVEDIRMTEEDIFICNNMRKIYRFDKSGRFLNTIGESGHGPGEYVFILSYCVHPKLKEIYLKPAYQKKIMVFDYEGKLKREFPVGYVADMICLSDTSLLIEQSMHPFSTVYVDESPYREISLQDGSLLHAYIQKPETDPYIHKPTRASWNRRHMLKYKDEVILTHYAYDTIYSLHSDGRWEPRYIKTPSNYSLGKSRLFYDLAGETSDFALIHLYYVVFNPDPDFVNKWLYVDKRTGEVYTYKVFAPNVSSLDYPYGELLLFYINSVGLDNVSIDVLHAFVLQEFFQQGKLEGELKEIASGLTEDSNPVLMVVKFKDQPLK